MLPHKVPQESRTLRNRENIVDEANHRFSEKLARFERSPRASQELGRLRKDHRGVAIAHVPSSPLGISARGCLAKPVSRRYRSVLRPPSLRAPTLIRHPSPDRPSQGSTVHARLSPADNADSLDCCLRPCHHSLCLTPAQHAGSARLTCNRLAQAVAILIIKELRDIEPVERLRLETFSSSELLKTCGRSRIGSVHRLQWSEGVCR
jgi:hypothetical protein